MQTSLFSSMNSLPLVVPARAVSHSTMHVSLNVHKHFAIRKYVTTICLKKHSAWNIPA